MSDEKLDLKEVHVPDQVYDRVLRMIINSVLGENKPKSGKVTNAKRKQNER